MTNQTPGTKASSASALLASLPSNPLPNTPPGAQDFLSVILQAISQPGEGKSRGENSRDATASKKDSASQPPVPAKNAEPVAPPDPLLASLILGLLAKAVPPALLTSSPKTSPATVTGTEGGTETKKMRGMRESGQAAHAQPSPPASVKLDAMAQKQAVDPSKKPAAAGGMPLYDSATAAGITAADAEAAIAAVQSPPGRSGKGAGAAPNATAPLSITRPSPTGTSAALGNTRMTFATERNEIAGRTEQKLPPGQVSATIAPTGSIADPTSKGGAKLSLEFNWRETPAENLALIDISSKTANPLVATPSAGAPAAAPAAQMDRLEQLISHQALTLRQTGADTMGVSLKVDANTQLLLQLTTQNGQIQATLRCEKGSFTAQDEQWTQLQASLAKQNVQLTPPATGTASNFGQSPENQSRHFPRSREEWTPDGSGVPPAQQRKPKTQSRSRQNWESWA